MNENNNDIQKHQEEKLQIEIELLKAEKAKMDLEKLRLEKEINKPWYKKERYLQAFFAGIVAVPLLWFFFKDVALPIYQKENVKLEYENELAK